MDIKYYDRLLNIVDGGEVIEYIELLERENKALDEEGIAKCELIAKLEEENRKFKNQWISVEEHRPTESSLLQFEDGSMAVGFYDNNWECWRTRVSGEDYVILHKEGKKPIVWQPLPPKYEG